ncbi:MAG: hypothetical protein FWD45_06410, partial [Coriobacteriia bacterium]|nr:hypothetical protein [Coriobacteriia bacterium]
MDKNSKSSTTTTSLRTPAHHHDEVRERMYSSSAAEITELLTMLNTSWDGLDKDAIAASRE